MDPDENTPQVDPTFAAGMAAAHGPFSGTHRHAHSTYGAQGGDLTHEHSHTHMNDNRHQHEHPAAQQASTPGVWPFGQMVFCRGGAAPAEPVTAAALTAASIAATGSPWGIAHDPDGPWDVLTADGTVAWSQDSYADALARVGEQMAADRPVLAERWRSDMAYEGVSTGDGRYINPGGIEYRDTPLPLMLQTVTEGGHYGAVLAGTILETGKVGATATGAGTFDDSDAGRQFVAIIAARGKFGVSIDVAEAEGEFVCTEYDDEGDCIDGEVRFDLIRVMGLCYDDQTEILSEHGWVNFADLPRGTRVATRNQKTNEFEWQEPVHYTHDKWAGKMIRFTAGGVQSATDPGRRHRALDLLVTPNHRMLVEETSTGNARFITAEELATKSNRTFRIPAVSEWNAPDVELFRIDGREAQPEGLCVCGCGETVAVGMVALPNHGHGYMTEPLTIDGDDFAALMGAWLAEGWTTGTGVWVAQRRTSKGFSLFSDVLGRLGWTYVESHGRFRIKSTRLAAYLRQFGHAKEKFIPEELKNFSKRQLRIFWDHYMAGDGSADGRKAFTSSLRLAGDLQEVAQKLGMWAVVGQQEGGGNVIDGRTITATGPQYVVAIRNRPGSRKAAAVWDWRAEVVEDYEGDVRCVTVPNECLYVRRNGIPIWCGNTGTPFPAFEGAYIEIPQAAEPAEPVAAAAPPAGAEPCHDCMTPEELVAASAAALTHSITADGGPALAPSRLYANPGLTRPTRTRVEEVDGVLHTYGHLATWNRCHTGYSDRCVPPPHSPSDYAFFNSGPLPTADGQIVHVGQITMGTGHANRSSRTPLNQVMAHYDGGPGAITVADVRLGEDEVGIWFSGVIRPDLTAEQVRRFQAEKLSGDWREVQRGQGLEQVALLAGVPVPGFPVHEPHEDGESLAASTGTHAMYDDGRLVVLQASYSVHEPEAWELRAEAQEERIRALEERLEAAERVTTPLRPMAVERLVASAS